MNNGHMFFRYATGNSKMHLMNSKMKILWLITTLIAILLINDYTSAVIVSLFLFFLIVISKIDFMTYLSNGFSLWFFYVLLFVLLSLIFPFNFAIINTIKIFLIVILFLILTFTTSLSEIAWGFECCFEKLKKLNVPVSKISLKIAMDLKFIKTMFEQFKIVKKSMAYRGISNKNIGLKGRLFMISKVIPLSYKLSRRTAKVMKLRFYGNKKRTNYHDNKVTFFDKVLVVIPFVILYFVIWLGWC